MKLLDELMRRGLIAQMTHRKEIEELLDKDKVTFYIGFDATADSLHIGHFLQLVVMKHFKNAGHRPIALLGTGTTMIGDPTGKTDMRKMLSIEEINNNAECFKIQMSKFIDIEDNGFFLRNGDWLLEKNYIEFLRDIGKCFSVNKMLTAECFKSRLERGLSFIEFNYMLLQSYDFLYLNQNYDCKLQLGGDDQWSNIISGIDLVRRVEGKEVYGMTFTLLTTKEGKKMGKTEKGALWLDPTKVTPYEFFQYWRNVSDDDVINCLKLITFVPIEEIESYESLEGSELNKIKEKLAYEVTKLVHGGQQAEKCLETSRNLFSDKKDISNIPCTKLESDIFNDNGVSLLDLLVLAKLCSSKTDARRVVEQGGVYVDDKKILDISLKFDKSDFEKGYIVIKKGKKNYHKIII